MYESEINNAIDLIKRGEKLQAHRVLDTVIKNDPNNERAWLWLSVCYEQNKEKAYCLRRVLEINPNNQHAKNGLKNLGGEYSQYSPTNNGDLKGLEQPTLVNSKNYQTSEDGNQAEKSLYISKKTITLLVLATLCVFCFFIFTLSRVPQNSNSHASNVHPTILVAKTLPPIWTPTSIFTPTPLYSATPIYTPTTLSSNGYTNSDFQYLIPPASEMKGYYVNEPTSGYCEGVNDNSCYQVTYLRSSKQSCFIKIEYQVTILPNKESAEILYKWSFNHFAPLAVKTNANEFYGVDKASSMLIFISDINQGVALLFVQDENMAAKIEVDLDKTSTSPSCTDELEWAIKIFVDKIRY